MNSSTLPKQSSPIINSSNKVNREKYNDLILVSTPFGIEIEVELISISSRVNGRRSARTGETSIYSFKFITILVIDLDWTCQNESGSLTVCRLGISIHDSIIQYQTRENNITRISETPSTSNRSDRC